jgi:hypothetical protein
LDWLCNFQSTDQIHNDRISEKSHNLIILASASQLEDTLRDGSNNGKKKVLLKKKLLKPAVTSTTAMATITTVTTTIPFPVSLVSGQNELAANRSKEESRCKHLFAPFPCRDQCYDL